MVFLWDGKVWKVFDKTMMLGEVVKETDTHWFDNTTWFSFQEWYESEVTFEISKKNSTGVSASQFYTDHGEREPM